MNVQYVRMIGLLFLIFIFNRRNSLAGTEIEVIIKNIIDHIAIVSFSIILFAGLSYLISVAGYLRKKK